jgi:hypothetical protein
MDIGNYAEQLIVCEAGNETNVLSRLNDGDSNQMMAKPILIYSEHSAGI